MPPIVHIAQTITGRHLRPEGPAKCTKDAVAFVHFAISKKIQKSLHFTIDNRARVWYN
jgi:hypothetical protein